MSCSSSVAFGFTYSRLPVAKLSTTTTSSPRSINASTRFDPMNPAPPVTTTRILRKLSRDHVHHVRRGGLVGEEHAGRAPRRLADRAGTNGAAHARARRDTGRRGGA